MYPYHIAEMVVMQHNLSGPDDADRIPLSTREASGTAPHAKSRTRRPSANAELSKEHHNRLEAKNLHRMARMYKTANILI
jgi:hypothetical protein